jgi:hypothetical protein
MAIFSPHSSNFIGSDPQRSEPEFLWGCLSLQQIINLKPDTEFFMSPLLSIL